MRGLINLLEYALISLARRWKKNLALIIIYALVVGFFASVVFLSGALNYESQTVLKDLPELWIQKLAGGRLQPMPLSLADSLSGIRGVRKVIPRVWGYYYDSVSGAVFTLVGSDSSVDGLYALDTDYKGSLDSSMVICGSGFLQSTRQTVGDYLSLFDAGGELRSFRIVGQFTAATDLLTRDLLILSHDSARRMLGLQADQCTDLALRVANRYEVENIALKISRGFSGLRAVTREELMLTYQALFSWRGGIFLFGGMIALLAFLILIWDRASGLSREDRRELGILKGIGWQINDVLWLKFWEGIIFSVTATLLGILAAYVHIFVFKAWLIKPFFIGWSVMYPEYDLNVVMDAGSLLIIFLISVIPYLSASIIPAWKGAITDPAEVMQGG